MLLLNTFEFTFKDIINGNFWEYIADILTNMWGFVVNWVSSLIQSLVMLLGIGWTFPYIAGFFPSIIGTSILLVCMISIAKVLTWQNHQ